MLTCTYSILITRKKKELAAVSYESRGFGTVYSCDLHTDSQSVLAALSSPLDQSNPLIFLIRDILSTH